MLKNSLLIAWRGLGRMTRVTVEVALLMAMFGALLVQTLRYQILPNVERYHEQITAAAIAAVGQPMVIGRIEANWDGFRPRLLFSDVKILDKQGQVALSLPRIENMVAWTSLLTLELRFHSLLIDSPDLSVRRDVQGGWYVAGIALGGQSSQDQVSADWLLHQSNVVIRNGRIAWLDEMRAAPLLVLEQVDLNIENRRGRHRFALRATPPEKIASRLDVRGNFSGDSFADLNEWHGQLYSQLDYADVFAWKPWLSLPKVFRRGKGALRIWLGFEKGQLRSLDADVALARVRARLAEELPPLELSELRGRIGWHATDRGFEIVTNRLALQMRDGFKVKPTDFYLRLGDAEGDLYKSGEMQTNALDIGDLVVLASYLPLSESLKQQLVEAAPQGKVSGVDVRWRNRADATFRFDVKGRFDRLALRRVGDRPGFSGLSGEVDGGDNGGSVSLDSRKFTLDAPQLFSEPVAFDTLTAQLGWQRNSRGLEFKLGNVALANPDLAGTIYGSYQTAVDGPGSVDATVDMKRVAVKMAGLYTPVPAVNQQTRDWLQAALQGGQADKFRVRLRGDLRDFPFVGNERGIFRLEAHASGVVMEFVKGWPKLEEADANLLIEGKKLEVNAVTATTNGAHLQNVKVGIPDLLERNLILQVRGEAVDSTQRCLDYIVKSPVNGYLDGFTEGIKARGDGRLNLQLAIPLVGDDPVKVRGDYHFTDNEIDIGAGVPLLRKVNGILLFTESSVNAGDIGAQILGGPAQLRVTSENGALLTKAHGKLDLGNLNKLTPHPLLDRVHGSTEWSADIRVQKKQVDVTVDSDLQGLDSDLPVPLAKKAEERIALHFEQKSISLKQDMLSLSYGTLIDAKLTRFKDADGEWRSRHGFVALGGALDADARSRNGIWVVGQIPQVSVEGWSGLGLASGGSGLLPNISRIDVAVDKLIGYSSTVNDLDIKGSSRNGLLSLKLESEELDGDVIWQPQGSGKLLGRFKNVMLGGSPGVSAQTVKTAAVKQVLPDNSNFPEVDVKVEKLVYKGRQLGRLEMGLSESDGDVMLDELRLTNPDGVLNMTGKWQAAPEQTQIQMRVDISDAGNILSRSGYPGSLKDGSGTLESNLYWSGAPETFDMNKLNGMLNLKVGKGRFLKVEAGAAKLLGVLSLQRASLDFSDVFSQGFQFEKITGNAQIVNGLMLTNDMKLTGAAAKVTMYGQIDLNRETQNLKVRILPSIGDNVSLLSFAAGPVVGVGVLLGNKILGDPLDKLVSIDYNISGSWADPKVERVGQAKQTQPAPTE